MNKKKLLLLTVIPLAALLLSACSGQKTAPTKNVSDQSAQSAPTATTSQADAQQVQQPQLQPLPADDKQAIDTELDNIDKDLKSTDNTVQSQDLSNVNLGL